MLDRLIYGGSFDPPHRSHMAVARKVLVSDVARRVDFVPAAVSPFKMDARPVASELRLAMLEAARNDPWIGYHPELVEDTRIVDLELRRPPPSYTVDTCRALREEFPGQRIGLLMGSDTLIGLQKWKNVDEILRHHEIVIYMRKGDDARFDAALTDLRSRFPEANFRRLDANLLAWSSTEIREAAARAWSRGEEPTRDDLGDCVADGVLELIRRHELYKRKD